MKKFALLLSVLLVSAISFGQVGFGIKGAVTMSSMITSFEDLEEAAKSGWQLGAFLRIGDKLHLQPEVYFTAKTGQLQYELPPSPGGSSAGRITQDITLNTVDIPLLIGYKIIDPPTLNIRLQAGPVASMVTSKTFEVSSEGIDPPEVEDEYRSNFSDINWGMQFGAGVDFLFLTADLRYELGLNKIFEGTTNSGDTGDYKNNVFMLSVGWKIF